MSRHAAHRSPEKGTYGVWLLGMALSATTGLMVTIATGMWGSGTADTVTQAGKRTTLPTAQPGVAQPKTPKPATTQPATKPTAQPAKPVPTPNQVRPTPQPTKPVVKRPVVTKPVTKKPVAKKPVAKPQPKPHQPTKPAVRPKPKPKPVVQRSAATSHEAALERQALAWLNKYRTSTGIPAVRLDACAQKEAAAWSHTMRTQKKMSHNPAPRCGPARAENVAAGSYRTVEALMTAWKNSPRHNANMRSKKYSGAAIAIRATKNQDGRTRWYATTVFVGK